MSSAPASRGSGRRTGGRLRAVEILLPLACFVSALVLGASELFTTFELTPPGGEPLQISEAGDRHSYALFVLAAFAVFALALAVMSGSKPAAFAVAAAGALALLIFLLADLPDAGKIGTLDDPRQSFIDAEAVPQAGFWLELLGALSLAVSGAALATLTPEQLAVGERFSERRRRRFEGAAPEGEGPERKSEPGADGEDPKASPTHRRREESEERPERVKDRVERARRSSPRQRGD